MNWVNFLHIYQPSDQTNEILEKVTNESYRPLFRGLSKIPKVKINLNINGALTELLVKKGYGDVVEDIRRLAETGRLEFTESAMYHPLLPFLKKEEIIRQIKKNNKTNKKYFGKAYNPSCFFPPEIAYSANVGKVVSSMGYPMILLDEISYDGGKSSPPYNELLSIKGTDMAVVFRERRVSNSIMSAIVRNKKEFIDQIKEDLEKKKYICTAMDGETFGHHRPGLEKTLFKIMEGTSSLQSFFSDLVNLYEKKREIQPIPCTWASATEDINRGIQFYSWKDPKNKVHETQWKFLNYLTSVARKKELSSAIYDKIDKAMASDQFFWASGEPWWSIEMIEKGAWSMLEALKSIPGISKKEKERAEGYYKDILSSIFDWQRSGKIESLSQRYKESVKIPFKERTLEDSKPEVYYAFVDTMKKKMKEAAKEKNFEKAILWRDAIWKLETKNDIYDAIHAVDLLRIEVSDVNLRKLMDKYKKRYNEIKSGQPERRKA